MNKEKLNVVIPAAGFGTRLGKEGENLPKGLIDNGSQTVLGLLLKNLEENVMGLAGNKPRVVLVSNGKFYRQYEKWLEREKESLGLEVELVDNGVLRPEKRRGAVADLLLGIEQVGEEGWVLVLPSDTDLGEMNLAEVVELAWQKQANVTVGRKAEAAEIAGRFGCMRVEGKRVVGFEEKPTDPQGDVLAIPVYMLNQEAVVLVKNLLERAKKDGDLSLVDAPGVIIEELLKVDGPVYVALTEAETIDVGTKKDKIKFSNKVRREV